MDSLGLFYIHTCISSRFSPSGVGRYYWTFSDVNLCFIFLYLWIFIYLMFIFVFIVFRNKPSFSAFYRFHGQDSGSVNSLKRQFVRDNINIRFKNVKKVFFGMPSSFFSVENVHRRRWGHPVKWLVSSLPWQFLYKKTLHLAKSLINIQRPKNFG